MRLYKPVNCTECAMTFTNEARDHLSNWTGVLAKTCLSIRRRFVPGLKA